MRLPSQNWAHQQEVSSNATERELAQVEKEPAQALAARKQAVVERMKSERAMALVPAPAPRMGWERRAEVQEPTVQAPALVEAADAGMGTGLVAVEPQVGLLGPKAK